MDGTFQKLCSKMGSELSNWSCFQKINIILKLTFDSQWTYDPEQKVDLFNEHLNMSVVCTTLYISWQTEGQSFTQEYTCTRVKCT